MKKNPIISANAAAHIITHSRHGGSTWMPPSDFHFTAADYSVALAPLLEQTRDFLIKIRQGSKRWPNAGQ